MKLFFLSGPFLHCVELMRPHQVHQIKSNLSTIQLSIGPHETDVSLFVSSVQLGHAAADSAAVAHLCSLLWSGQWQQQSSHVLIGTGQRVLDVLT